MSTDWDTAVPATNGAERAGSVPADFRNARRRKSAELIDPTKIDHLPPHSIEGEQGVLGCILLAPMEAIPNARKRLRDPEGEEFYDLRHREIWLTLGRMYDDRIEGKPICSDAAAGHGIDLITLQQRLKDYQKLDQVGGLVYLASLPDAVPSSAHLNYYLEIVAEKFRARQLVWSCTEVAGRVMEWPGQVDTLLQQFQDDVARLAGLATAPEEAARLYLRPVDMGDEFFHRWFGRRKGVHGLRLPELAFGNFPFLVRTRELTLIEAETKMGKSTLTSYTALHLLEQGMQAVIDSREVQYADTLALLVTQLTGVASGQLCQEGERQAKTDGHLSCQCAVCAGAVQVFNGALAWLQPRVCINRTTGIKHWRDILEAFHELARQGWNFFVLDSLMRIGIADDDFTQQAACVSSFAQFCLETNSAMWLINHRNKGDGDYRQKSGGSYKVAANAANICSVRKNEKKFEKLAPWLDLLRGRTISYEEFREQPDVVKCIGEWDAKFFVHDQRLQGTHSNAARELWFLKRSGQYFDHRHERPRESVNWLERWRKKSAGADSAAAADSNEDVAKDWPAAGPEVDA